MASVIDIRGSQPLSNLPFRHALWVERNKRHGLWLAAEYSMKRDPQVGRRPRTERRRSDIAPAHRSVPHDRRGFPCPAKHSSALHQFGEQGKTVVAPTRVAKATSQQHAKTALAHVIGDAVDVCVVPDDD